MVMQRARRFYPPYKITFKRRQADAPLFQLHDSFMTLGIALVLRIRRFEVRIPTGARNYRQCAALILPLKIPGRAKALGQSIRFDSRTRCQMNEARQSISSQIHHNGPRRTQELESPSTFRNPRPLFTAKVRV